MTRGPLFAAGADGEGTRNPKGRAAAKWAWSLDGRQKQAMAEQLRWQCFKEE